MTDVVCLRACVSKGAIMTPPRSSQTTLTPLRAKMLQTRVVRSYGLYQPTQTAALALCRAALGQPPVVVLVSLDWQTACPSAGTPIPNGVRPVVPQEKWTVQPLLD